MKVLVLLTHDRTLTALDQQPAVGVGGELELGWRHWERR